MKEAMLSGNTLSVNPDCTANKVTTCGQACTYTENAGKVLQMHGHKLWPAGHALPSIMLHLHP
eukprot:1159566-Pelagomonas_calceolata.AAC.27